MSDMTLGERLLKSFGFRSEQDFAADLQEAVKVELDAQQHQWALETADAQYWDLASWSEDPVYFNQSDMYRLSPLVGTALDILGNDVGLSKLNVFELDGEEENALPNHEFEMLMQHPNPLDSGLEFMRDSAIGYKVNGNHVWWLNRTSEFDKPLEMWPIPFEMIRPVPDKRLYISHYNYFPGMGKPEIELPVWQIVHFKNYNPHNRFVGLSLIESLAITLTGDQGMRKTNTTTYTKYNGSPPSVLAFKDWVPDETWRDVKIEKNNAAMRNEMMMLRGVGDGVSWLSRTISAKDAEFIETLKSNMETVFNRMAPGLLAMLSENATEANALAARATYAEKTWWALLETFAQKITKNPLPAYALDSKILTCHFDDPRSVDRKLKLEEQSTYERTHTIDEVRQEFYGDDPLGDERGNMIYSEIGAVSVSNPTAAINPTEQPQENETAQETDTDSVSMKAALDEMQVWRRMALRGKRAKAQNFLCAYIPSDLALSIKADLKSAKSKEQIAAIFERGADRLRPQQHRDAASLLRGIEAGLKALELNK